VHLEKLKTFVWKRATSKVSEMPQQLFGQRAARVRKTWLAQSAALFFMRHLSAGHDHSQTLFLSPQSLALIKC
jgi:hypothetical protein